MECMYLLYKAGLKSGPKVGSLSLPLCSVTHTACWHTKAPNSKPRTTLVCKYLFRRLQRLLRGEDPRPQGDQVALVPVPRDHPLGLGKVAGGVALAVVVQVGQDVHVADGKVLGILIIVFD